MFIHHFNLSPDNELLRKALTHKSFFDGGDSPEHNGKLAYLIICAKFQVISRHFSKLPYFTQISPHTKSWILTGDKGDWLKMIFFIKAKCPKPSFYNNTWSISPSLCCLFYHPIRLILPSYKANPSKVAGFLTPF